MNVVNITLEEGLLAKLQKLARLERTDRTSLIRSLLSRGTDEVRPKKPSCSTRRASSPSSKLHVLTCNDPIKCLVNISENPDLLLVDLEMPGLDGSKVLSYAVAKGLSKNRIIILSGRDADYPHQRFPMGSCLAVLNKFELKQKDVLDMVFKSLQRKTTSKEKA